MIGLIIYKALQESDEPKLLNNIGTSMLYQSVSKETLNIRRNKLIQERKNRIKLIEDERELEAKEMALFQEKVNEAIETKNKAIATQENNILIEVDEKDLSNEKSWFKPTIN